MLDAISRAKLVPDLVVLITKSLRLTSLDPIAVVLSDLVALAPASF